MSILLGVLSVVLLVVILVQIGKVTELSAKIRGEEETKMESNNRNALGMLVFLVLFLVFCIGSAWMYKNSILWYGPHESASVHGGELDGLFNLTLFFTGIVFVVTHILLFWFAFKYRRSKTRKALFIAHDNKLELIWTVVPAVVMSFLVINGLVAWNKVMADVPDGEEHIEIEATGMQFAWMLRMPGKDGLLGRKDYKLITANNQLGQDWEDPKNYDDYVSTAPGEIIKLPVNTKVRVRITSRDVLHNFDLPHFRVKMDAIPGLPTYFVFEPSLTTEEYRANLGALDERTGEPLYPEWHTLDEDGVPRWKRFHFELACAELCGKGHYSMRRLIEVVSYDEWKAWADELPSFYMSTIRNTDEDPNLGKLLEAEVLERKAEFKAKVDKAMASDNVADKVVRFDYVNFETGSAKLTALSRYELENLVEFLNANSGINIELAGHTDNTGDAESNKALSERRAQAVYEFLTGQGVAMDRMTAVGYGQDSPIADNATDEGREQNRRTEFRILSPVQ